MSGPTSPPILIKKSEDAEEEKPPIRKELPYNFEKELIESQNRHIRGHYTFVPCGKVYPLAAKFYAKHEQNRLNYEKFLDFVNQRGKNRPRSVLPHLSSEYYGWTPVDLSESIKELNFICAPKIRTDMTIHGEKIANERVTERPPFNGLRFVL